MTKRVIAFLLVLCMLPAILPLAAFAEGTATRVAGGTEKPAAKEDVVIRKADGSVSGNIDWEQLYPYGTFAFGDAGGEIVEGGEDGMDALLIPVYRLGGTDGRATAVIRYSPDIFLKEDGSIFRDWAISARDDIELSFELPNPIAEYQKLSAPTIAPAPEGVKLDLKEFVPEDGEDVNGLYPATIFPVFPDANKPEVTAYAWQYRKADEDDTCWRSMENADTAEFDLDLDDVVDANGIVLYDYRLLYETSDGWFCTPTLLYGDVYDPSFAEAQEIPGDIELGTDPVYEKLQATEKYEAFEFELTFADGEWVKYISVKALDDDTYEPDEMGTFTITECIGGTLSDECNTFELSLADNDLDKIKPSFIGFALEKISADQDDGCVEVTVRRYGDLSYITSVHYATVDGTAKTGEQYAPVSGELIFGADTAASTVKIPLVAEKARSKALSFSLVLSEIKGGDGACTLDKAEVCISLTCTGALRLTSDDGVLGAGLNLATLLRTSGKNDVSGEAKTSDTPLIGGETETPPVTEEQRVKDIAAKYGYSNNLGIHDYEAVLLRRNADYLTTPAYWKDYETPYYGDGDSNSDSVGYHLSGAKFYKKGNFTTKSNGRATLSTNYDTTTPASLSIPNAGILFSEVSYRFDVTKIGKCGQFLGIGYNYVMPWINIRFGDDKTKCDFRPQDNKGNPLKDKIFSGTKALPFGPTEFYADMNMTLNDAGENSTKHENFTYVPDSSTELVLSELSFKRRVMTKTDSIPLRIYTANDSDSVDCSVLNALVYDKLRPTVTLVQGASGVTAGGDLYVGSTICVTLPSVASYRAYGNTDPSETVFLTKPDGTKVNAKVERKNDSTYYVTFLWDGITEADLAETYRINVVYERVQNVKFDITPSLERDESGNVKVDASSLKKSWDSVFSDDGRIVNVTLTYSKRDEKAASGYTLETKNVPLSSLIGSTVSPYAIISPNETGIRNLQKINFGLGKDDIILFNGEQYLGNEDILLSGSDLTAETLTFTFYDSTMLEMENIMELTVSHTELYFDGNGNGKIDGYYDEATGLFILDEKSGDVFFGLIDERLPADLLQPTVNMNGDILQYFFKVYYTMTPRALRKGTGTAQVLPAFLPQNTDARSLASLTFEQKSYRMISAGATTILPYDKKTGKTGDAYDVADTSEGHLMFGAEATKQSTLDIPLGGDIRTYQNMTITVNGETKAPDIPDFAGNLRVPFDNPEPIIATNTQGKNEQIADVNGYLGSFVGSTTFVLGVQETAVIRSQNDFNAESIVGGGCYAVPVNHVAATTGEAAGGELDYNAGNQKSEVTSVTDFDTEIGLPSMSLSLFGVSATFLTGDQVMLSFGIPVASWSKDLNYTGEKVEENAATKQTTETQLDADGTLITKKTLTDKQTGATTEVTVADCAPKTVEYDNESWTETVTYTKYVDSDGHENYNKHVVVTNHVIDGEEAPDMTYDVSDEYNAVKNEWNWSQGENAKDWLATSGAQAFALDGLISYLKGDHKKEFEDMKKRGTGRSCTVSVSLILQWYAVLQYDALEGGWELSTMSGSVTAVFSIDFKHRMLTHPWVYFFVRFSLYGTANFNAVFSHEYTKLKELLPDGNSYKLGKGESLTFTAGTFSYAQSDSKGISLLAEGDASIEFYSDTAMHNLLSRTEHIGTDGVTPTEFVLASYGKAVYAKVISNADDVVISEINRLGWSGERTEIENVNAANGKQENTGSFYKLNNGKSVSFTLDTTEKVNDTEPQGFSLLLSGKVYMKVYTDPSFDEASLVMKGTLNSDGSEETNALIGDCGDRLYVRLTALEDGVTIDDIFSVDSKMKSAYDGFSLYGELNFEIGVGFGIEVMKAEFFAKINGKITGHLTPDQYLESFTVTGAISMRIKLLMFEFVWDLVGVIYTGGQPSSSDPIDTHLYFEYFGHREEIDTLQASAGGQGVHVSGPTSTAKTQSLYRAYNDSEYENAFHPTDPEVKFELSGYASGGDAFKLADHLDSGYSYRGINVDGETYLLYMISDPDVKDNPLNASRLVLSKVVTIGDHPGIVHPFDVNNTARPYLEIDSAAVPAEATGDLAFCYALENKKLTVTYTCYDKHFAGGEETDITEAGNHITVKRASVDLAGDKDTVFSVPETVSDSDGAYRFLPEMAGNITFYGETSDGKANSARDAMLRAYLNKVYGITDDDLADPDHVDASKAQYVYRYVTQSAFRTLSGDNSLLVAVGPDGKAVSAPLSQNGEILTSLEAENVNGIPSVFYTTEQEAYFDLSGKTVTDPASFNEDTDYAVIDRLYFRTFENGVWGEPKLLRTVVNFEKCTNSTPADHPLQDGVYSGVSMSEAYVDPTLSGIRFLQADLDGNGVKPIFVFEMNENAYLLDNEALTALQNGGELTVKPVFDGALGTNVTIASDKEGNLALAYLATAAGTDSNEICLAWWDKALGRWGEGTVLAQNHLSVAENAAKYGLSAAETEKAFLGEQTGNVEYDAYASSEDSEKGAYDRFVFSDIQLLPSTVTTVYGDGTTGVKEQLILLTDGVYTTLAKGVGEIGGETTEYLYEDENFGNGFYAIAFGCGEQDIGNASLTLDSYTFSTGSVLSGKVSFANTGNTAIRGSADQPVTVELVAINEQAGYLQTLNRWQISGMIASGKQTELSFRTAALTTDLPAGTEFRLLVSEDAEYIEQSGGKAFSDETDALLTVKNGPELAIEALSYEILSMDDDFVTVATDFTVTNRGSEKAEGLFVQYTAEDGENRIPLDIEGSVLRVSNEKVITKVANELTVTDLANGVVALKDTEGKNDLSAGYYRSVTGTLKIRRADFSAYASEGLKLCVTLFSDADQFTMKNGTYVRTETKEYTDADNVSTVLLRHRTDFTVPSNLSMSLENTLRTPVGFTSTNVGNEIVVREISDGTETWTSLFNDIYYDLSHDTIVAVANKTGHTVIQIEDRKTNSFREIAVQVGNAGLGVNISPDDDSFIFKNADGSDVQEASPGQSWKFRSGANAWNGETGYAPMNNDYNVATKVGASVSFRTVATTLTVYYSGKIKVESDLFPEKTVTADNTGTKDNPLTVRFDNLDGKQHTVTITALAEETQLDRYTATYPEEAGIVTKSDKTAPDFYWQRSFPNTASIVEGGEITISCYVADDLGISGITVNGEPASGVKQLDERLWRFNVTFDHNGQYIFTATDTDGNKTTHTLAVHWFNEILNKDALRTAPEFDAPYIFTLDADGKKVTGRADTVYLASSYKPKTVSGEILYCYAGGNGTILPPNGEVTSEETSFTGFTYPTAYPVTQNGFHLLRVVAEDGTWSQAMFDVRSLNTKPVTVKLETKADDTLLLVTVDATASGVLPLTVELNGFELTPRPTELVTTYYFPITAGGWYRAEVYNGTDTYTGALEVRKNVGGLREALIVKNPEPNEASNGKFTFDIAKLTGGSYDTALSDPEKNLYVRSYEFAVVPGDHTADIASFDGANWKTEVTFDGLELGFYTAAVRDKNDKTNVSSLYTVLGVIPPLTGKVTLTGDPLKGQTMTASYDGEAQCKGHLTYQWYRSKDGKTTEIPGATGKTYTVTPADIFYTLSCKVTSDFETGELWGKNSTAVGVAAHDTVVTYDGHGHNIYIESIGRSDLQISYTVRDKVPGKIPSYTDVGTYTITYYVITNPASYVLPTYRYYGDRVSGSATLTIEPRDITGALVYLSEPYYNGKEVTCNVTKVQAGTVDATFEVTGNKATEIGEYTMTITGTGNFKGSIEVKWHIKPIDISKYNMTTFQTNPNPVYDGTEKTAGFAWIRANGLDVTYTATGDKATEAGNYTMTITGTGNFTGTKTVTWKILQKDIADAEVKLAADSIEYTGNEISPQIVSVTADGLPVTYTVSGNKATEPGVYKMTLTGTGNFKGTKVVYWEINNCSFGTVYGKLTADLGGDEYAGTRVRVTGKDCGKSFEVTADEHGIVHIDQIAIGDYIAELLGVDANGKTIVTYTVEFSITRDETTLVTVRRQPPTGDTTPVFLWLFGVSFALTLLIALLLKKRFRHAK